MAKKAAVNRRILNAVADNASAADRTITMGLPFNAVAVRLLVRTTWTDATAVTSTPTGSADGTNYHSWTSRATSGGTGTLSAFTDSYAVSAAATFMVEYDVTGLTHFKTVMAITGGSAGGETMTIDAIVVTEQ